MFTAQVKGQIESAFDQVFDLMGVPAVFTRVPGGAPINVLAGVAQVKPSDEAIVNAYGVDAQIITLKAVAIGGVTPKKFDTLELHGRKRTIEAVHAVSVNGDVRFFRCYIKGHTP